MNDETEKAFAQLLASGQFPAAERFLDAARETEYWPEESARRALEILQMGRAEQQAAQVTANACHLIYTLLEIPNERRETMTAAELEKAFYDYGREQGGDTGPAGEPESGDHD